jgi:hypothetical protein
VVGVAVMLYLFHFLFRLFNRRKWICSSEGDERQGVPCRISVMTARCAVKLKKKMYLFAIWLFTFYTLLFSIYSIVLP